MSPPVFWEQMVHITKTVKKSVIFSIKTSLSDKHWHGIFAIDYIREWLFISTQQANSYSSHRSSSLVRVHIIIMDASFILLVPTFVDAFY